jgi:hypothetical protein
MSFGQIVQKMYDIHQRHHHRRRTQTHQLIHRHRHLLLENQLKLALAAS